MAAEPLYDFGVEPLVDHSIRLDEAGWNVPAELGDWKVDIQLTRKRGLPDVDDELVRQRLDTIPQALGYASFGELPDSIARYSRLHVLPNPGGVERSTSVEFRGQRGILFDQVVDRLVALGHEAGTPESSAVVRARWLLTSGFDLVRSRLTRVPRRAGGLALVGAQDNMGPGPR